MSPVVAEPDAADDAGMVQVVGQVDIQVGLYTRIVTDDPVYRLLGRSRLGNLARVVPPLALAWLFDGEFLFGWIGRERVALLPGPLGRDRHLSDRSRSGKAPLGVRRWGPSHVKHVRGDFSRSAEWEGVYLYRLRGAGDPLEGDGAGQRR